MLRFSPLHPLKGTAIFLSLAYRLPTAIASMWVSCLPIIPIWYLSVTTCALVALVALLILDLSASSVRRYFPHIYKDHAMQSNCQNLILRKQNFTDEPTTIPQIYPSIFFIFEKLTVYDVISACLTSFNRKFDFMNRF